MVDIKVFWLIEHTSLLNLKPMNSADFEEGHIEDLVFMFSFGKIILPFFCQNRDLFSEK